MAILQNEVLRPITTYVAMAARISALITTILLLILSLHYKGGLSLYSNNPSLIINCHMMIMFIGFIYVFGEAIMAYKNIPGPRKARKAIHGFLHLFALSMCIFGVYVAFKFHNKASVPDMYTLHSWLGMITICLFGIQWLFGVCTFGYPKIPLQTRVMAKPWHIFAGLTIFILALCTAETGLMQTAVVPGTEATMIIFTALGIIAFGFAVCLCILLPRLIHIQTSIV
ncbi:hypothetical protein ZOSMA_80G00180 [Zostera marina]|uniref:Cytochrome b561 domain-containing protein n=1 Tax=Zostera marina TaxID=29655 RepID=A0A0K9NPB4_ZOSMR|nr:hypothetical protein ZOSMA_80G00180 [Zostera marina]